MFQSTILDAIVVGQQRALDPYLDTTERVLLFIQVGPNQTSCSLFPSTELGAQIRGQITKDLSRRHVPSYVFVVSRIPYNTNGKKMEIQVKKVVNGS